MHRPGPERPGGVGGPLGEIIHVDVVPSLGVSVAELHDGAGELPVPREPVHLLPVLDGVARVEPVCVLELYRLPLEVVGEGIGELYRLEELSSVDKDVLSNPGKLVREEIKDEIIPLVFV